MVAVFARVYSGDSDEVVRHLFNDCPEASGIMCIAAKCFDLLAQSFEETLEGVLF
ncbi:hypothetical protein D3C78_1775460 [compost metagenome]